MYDSFNRKIDYLRFPVTDRCDLRCKYCMPVNMKFTDKRNEVQVHDMISATCTSIINSFNKIKENIKE